MKILHLLPILPPKQPGSEALSQDIAALQQVYEGTVRYINPNTFSPVPVPRLLFGFHCLAALRRQERTVDLVHFWSPDLFPYPVLRLLRKPVIFALTGAAGQRRPNVSFLNGCARVAVLDERTARQLRAWGVHKVTQLQPGIDTNRFTWSPPPPTEHFHLVMASAPWTPAQFRQKGVDALLAAVQQEPSLHLTLLWRGVLSHEIRQRVAAAGVADRVQVVDQFVDVNTVLAGVHAAVVLAETGSIVKAYPHSLVEALAAGRPVLVSNAIPMADYVAATGCGQVVGAVTPAAVLTAIAALRSQYHYHQVAAQAAGQRDFSRAAMLAAIAGLYRQVIA